MGRYQLEHSDVWLTNVHSESLCIGPRCPIHNKSDHAFRKFPQCWFNYRIWRRDPLGNLYPDPDSDTEFYDTSRKSRHLKEMSEIIRNAARCLKCGDEIESTHRHDFVSCYCSAIYIDGGKEYVRAGGNPEDFESLVEYRIEHVWTSTELDFD